MTDGFFCAMYRWEVFFGREFLADIFGAESGLTAYTEGEGVIH
jgi:hypothetical protein